MKMKIRIIPVAAMLFAACSSSDRELTDETHPVCEMTVLDTIGVDVGNQDYVFGNILGADTDPEGNLLVLDGVSCTVKIFSPEGEHLGCFGGLGSGPGEFLQPLDLAVLPNGEIAVTDWESWGIFFFNGEYEYQRFLGPMPGGAPMEIIAGDESSLTGLALSFWHDEDVPRGEYYLASWTDTPEETFRFLEGAAAVVPGEEGRLTISLPEVEFDSGPGGELCAALSTDSTYAVHRFSAEGENLGEIRREWERVTITDDVRCALEEAAVFSGETDPEIPVFANAIAGVFCDSEERIWVRLGTASTPEFHIYSSEGQFIDTAVCPELHDPLFELDFHFSGNRVYAWNTDPVDYPRIYIMGNPL